MTVTPFRKQHFQTYRDLYQSLSSGWQRFCETKEAQILSFSLEIQLTDPLNLLHLLAPKNCVSFYFEKRDNNTELVNAKSEIAIAAIGAALQKTFVGRDRFAAAKQFIQETLAHTQILGSAHLPNAGPHFFCGFRFFSEDESAEFKTILFLPEWQISYQENHCVAVANIVIDDRFSIEKTYEKIRRTLQKIHHTKSELVKPIVCQPPPFQMMDVTSSHHFQSAVDEVLQTIASGQLDKVVLAHAVDVRSPLPFHPVDCLQNLRSLYPGCYLFAINNGAGKVFLGASPERLVSLQQGHLLTDALAGSAPRGATPCEDAQLADRLLNSVKELHEHEVVRDFILQQLQQLGISPTRSPLRLRQLPNIQHLHTPIHAPVSASLHLLDVVAQLHPTPAVAGLPCAIACDQIRRYEGFDRSLYAAPIGWVDHHGNGEFVVGIRSAMIEGCHARLFAGAGIVKGSAPEKEWAEVRLKMQALLRALAV